MTTTKLKLEKILKYWKVIIYIFLLIPSVSEAASIQEILYFFNEGLWGGWLVIIAILAGALAFIPIIKLMKNIGNEEEISAFKKILPWAIITFFVMFSFWGIIQILQYIFFGSDFVDSIPE